MSGFVSEPLRSGEQQLAASKHGASEDVQGQRHDRSPSAGKPDRSMTTAVDAEQKGETDISASQRMLSAMSGSLLTSLLVTPLDVVRVRLQSQPPPKPIPTSTPVLAASAFANLPRDIGVTACCREVFWVNNASPFCIAAATPTTTYTTLNPSLSTSSQEMQTAADCAVDETRRRTFTSTFDGLRKIARHEGPTSLWRGLSPTLVMAIPGNVIYFTGYDSLRTNPHSPIRNYVPDSYAPLVAGSIARVAAASAISPVEMFRTRMQAATTTSSTSGGPGVFSTTLHGLRKMVQAQGYSSLWRGLTLTMWRDVPFSGIYWWGYEAGRAVLTDLRESGDRGPSTRGKEHPHTDTFVDSFISGAVSGAVASIVTTPFDVGKTRRQVLEGSSADSAGRAGRANGVERASPEWVRLEERSMPRFMYNIWKEEGMSGLFRGWAARVLKVAPACAIMISSYEIGKKMAQRMNDGREE